MIVSLLQLMGFPKGKPVHSPAESNRSTSKNKTTAVPASAQDSGAGPSARRHDVKTKPQVASKKAESKAAVPTKSASSATAKPAAKAGALKVSAKPATKVVAKPVAPVAAKKTAAPAKVSATSQSAAKPAGKATAPKVSPATVPVQAVATKAKPADTGTVTSTRTKASAQSVPAAVKLAAAPVKTAAKPAATIAPAASSVPKAAAPAAVALAKSPRPSSRLAQVTVPSMAQSVASTAPKASFTPFKESPVIAPAPSASIKKDPKLANNWKSKSADQLSDAELMAMPDAEYMNEIQMAAFRHRLVGLKQGILNNAGETTEHLREDTSIVPDPADRATIEEEHALELRTRDRERKLLKKIETSIARIDAGDYGYCDETGEPIGVGRLLARPTATLSLEAQQRRELKQKMYGD